MRKHLQKNLRFLHANKPTSLEDRIRLIPLNGENRQLPGKERGHVVETQKNFQDG